MGGTDQRTLCVLILQLGWCVRQPEVQSKVDILGTLPAEHWLNLVRQIRKMATRINRQFLAVSDALNCTLN